METMEPKTKLDDAHLAFHQVVIARAQAADREQVAAQGTVETWNSFLAKTYDLHEGDGVALDGTIVRKGATA